MDDKNNSCLKPFFEKYSIYVILIFAFALRYRGIDFGLPYLYNPDEPFFIDPPIHMLVTGDLNPHWFGHPGSFVMYFLLVLFSVYFIFYFLFGYVHNLSDFQQLFINEPSLFYFSGRLLILFFCIFTIYLVYLIASKLFNRMVGILASFLLAISPLYIMENRLIRTDIAAAMLIMLSIYFLLSFFIDSQNKDKKSLIISSLFAGFSIAAKYTSGVIIFPILIHCLIIDSKQKYLLKNEKKVKFSLIGLGIFLILTGIFFDFSWLKAIVDLFALECERCKTLIINNSFLILAIAGTSLILIGLYFINIFNFKSNLNKAIIFIFIGFFIFAPFVILDPLSSVRDIIFENRGEHFGAERLPGIQNYVWYLTNPLQEGIGGLFFEIFAGLGLMIIIYKKSYEKYLFIIFPILYFLLVGSMKLRFDRWFIPILPFEAIFFGLGFYYTYKYIIEKKIFQDIPKIFPFSVTNLIFSSFVIIIIIASLPTITSDINEGTKLSKIDTRTIAKNWIENNLPNGSKIAYEYYTPQLHRYPRKNFTLMNLETIVTVGYNKTIVSKPLSYYKNQSVDYVIISSYYKGRFYNEPERFAAEISRYEELKNMNELIKIFESNENPGPVIEIYRLIP